MGKTSSQSKNKYNKKAYDRINVMLPKGKKDLYKKIAQSKGLSLNGYINKLLEANTKDEEIN
ncbi:MAG: antitoxin [Oscillospiraceae bacterium]|nr:antitoxin [Oscillospiraceae bacterium]